MSENLGQSDPGPGTDSVPTPDAGLPTGDLPVGDLPAGRLLGGVPSDLSGMPQFLPPGQPLGDWSVWSPPDAPVGSPTADQMAGGSPAGAGTQGVPPDSPSAQTASAAAGQAVSSGTSATSGDAAKWNVLPASGAALPPTPPNPSAVHIPTIPSPSRRPVPPALSWAGKRWALIVIIVCTATIVIAALIAGNHGKPAPTTGSTQSAGTLPSQPPRTPQPTGPHSDPPVLPQVVPDPVVTEAIDFPNPPVVGQSWNASDGNPADENMEADPYVTPCGVLATVLLPSGTATSAADSRIVGYHLPDGAKLWSVNLQQATGVALQTGLSVSLSFTASCQMVVSVVEGGTGEAGLAIDLATGTTTVFGDGHPEQCSAAGDHWAACLVSSTVSFFTPSQINVYDLTNPASPVHQWNVTSKSGGYLTTGQADFVVAGDVWTPDGYRDPSTGSVVFGSDATGGQNGVVYIDPRESGGYPSGLALRINTSGSSCQVNLWNTAADKAVWGRPNTMPCGGISTNWGIAGQALIASWWSSADSTMAAYELADGHQLWQRNGSPGISSLDTHSLKSDLSFVNPPNGLSARYVDLDQNMKDAQTGKDVYTQVRISDGVAVRLPFMGISLSDTMAYSDGGYTAEGKTSVTAYTIDPRNPATVPTQTWQINLGVEVGPLAWTFATRGVMYLVSDSSDEPITVVPLSS